MSRRLGASHRNMDSQHVPFPDTNLFECLRVIPKNVVIEKYSLRVGRDIGFDFDDSFEKLNGHISTDFQVNDVGIGLVWPNNADGDTPVRRKRFVLA